MKLEVLHIADCPNWEEAGRRLQTALATAGVQDAAISYRLLSSPADAAATAFAGSPTITVDGEDLFPSDGRTSDLACRVYFSPMGFAGLPTLDQITDALQQLADSSDIPCSCCGRNLPRRKLHALGAQNAYICRRCGLWVALRLRGDGRNAASARSNTISR
jgi:hypothetical protein